MIVVQSKMRDFGKKTGRFALSDLESISVNPVVVSTPKLGCGAPNQYRKSTAWPPGSDRFSVPLPEPVFRLATFSPSTETAHSPCSRDAIGHRASCGIALGDRRAFPPLLPIALLST